MTFRSRFSGSFPTNEIKLKVFIPFILVTLVKEKPSLLMYKVLVTVPSMPQPCISKAKVVMVPAGFRRV